MKKEFAKSCHCRGHLRVSTGNPGLNKDVLENKVILRGSNSGSQPYKNKSGRDAEYQLLSMTLLKQGFTLIELLVVVLIIGILAAIALPQYKVAVAKARYARMIPVVRSIKDSLDLYYMNNSFYPPDTTDDVGLDFTFPPGCTHQGSTWLSLCPDNYEYDLLDYGVPNMVGIDQRFKTAYVQWAAVSDHSNARRCMAAVNDKTANAVCKSLGGTPVSGENYRSMQERLGTVNVYALP